MWMKCSSRTLFSTARRPAHALHTLIAAAVLISLATLPAQGDEVAWDFGNADAPDLAAAPGEHSFQINNVPANSTTVWSVYYFYDDGENGWPKRIVQITLYTETDLSGAQAEAPRMTRNFGSQYSSTDLRVGATIETEGSDQTKSFELSVNLLVPVLFVEPYAPDGLYATPSAPEAGEPFTITAKIENSGDAIASAGPDQDQEARFFVDGVFWCSVPYDDVEAEGHVFVETPPIEFETPGEHVISVLPDATNVINEYQYECDDDRCDFGKPFTMNGTGWAQMPDVEGLSAEAAEAAILAAGFGAPTINVSYGQDLPANQAYDQSPAAGGWYPPGEIPQASFSVQFRKKCIIAVNSPTGSVYGRGDKNVIQWQMRNEAINGPCPDTVRIMLRQNRTGNSWVLTEETENDGRFESRVPRNLDLGKYTITIKGIDARPGRMTLTIVE